MFGDDSMAPILAKPGNEEAGGSLPPALSLKEKKKRRRRGKKRKKKKKKAPCLLLLEQVFEVMEVSAKGLLRPGRKANFCFSTSRDLKQQTLSLS